MFYKKLTYLLASFFLLAINDVAHAETTLVAVASNFTKPMTEIAAEFEKATSFMASKKKLANKYVSFL